MPRFLTPYENTPNAALWNARGQITRRQFEMLTEPETPMTRARLRRRRLFLLALGLAFVVWWALHEAWRGSQVVSYDLVLVTGGLLLGLCAAIIVVTLLRLLWAILVITPTADEIGASLRQRIRESTLAIYSVEGRLKFRHLPIGLSSLLCSVIVGGREFPISQALWEMLQQQPRAGRWTVFYLQQPYVVLSISRTDELNRALEDLPADEPIVSGNTVARRVDL
jgi:hypothetical protein